MSRKKSNMRPENTTTEPNHEAIAQKLQELFGSGNLTTDQDNILSDCMLELANSSGVWLDHPEIVYAFYMVASRYNAELEIRDELREVIEGIEQGEKFEGYSSPEGLSMFRVRQRCATLAKDKGISKEMRRRLKTAAEDPEHLLSYNFKELFAQAERSRQKGGAR
jgi:hypothetical protein